MLSYARPELASGEGVGEEGIRAIPGLKGLDRQRAGPMQLWHVHTAALIVASADPALADLQPLLHQQCAHRH